MSKYFEYTELYLVIPLLRYALYFMILKFNAKQFMAEQEAMFKLFDKTRPMILEIIYVLMLKGMD